MGERPLESISAGGRQSYGFVNQTVILYQIVLAAGQDFYKSIKEGMWFRRRGSEHINQRIHLQNNFSTLS